MEESTSNKLHNMWSENIYLSPLAGEGRGILCRPHYEAAQLVLKGTVAFCLRPRKRTWLTFGLLWHGLHRFDIFESVCNIVKS